MDLPNSLLLMIKKITKISFYIAKDEDIFLLVTFITLVIKILKEQQIITNSKKDRDSLINILKP